MMMTLLAEITLDRTEYETTEDGSVFVDDLFVDYFDLIRFLG